MTEILAQDGQMVQKDQVLLICRDREQELQISQLGARLAALNAKRAYGIAADANLRLIVDGQIEATNTELRWLKARQAKQEVRSPIAGRLSAPLLRNMRDKYIKEGEQIGFVANWDELRIVASIDQNDAAMVYFKNLGKGSQADVRPAASIWADGVWGWKKDMKATLEQLGDDADADWRRPQATWEVYHPSLRMDIGGPAEMDQTDPDGKKLLRPHVNVFLMMQNPGDELVPGQRAHLRFKIDTQPLYVNWSRRIWQVIQAHSRGTWT